MKNMSDVEVIMELEGGQLFIEDQDDWNRLKDLAYNLSFSQGFYGRLYTNMIDYEEWNGLEFPICM